ncbi:ethylene-responsive transcription factor ERF020-like [Typha angustifolia]|uniref:ethylene-responsive transcription factor ERF020-like n=1 Tax=Typha angustifolia TaxID=59011 RepID=UPI003C2B0DED
MRRTAEVVNEETKYKGVRRRRWGKWVSEIRVPGTRERLWLGSYSTPEAAAVAHDTAVFFLKGPSASSSLNFPERAAAYSWTGLSPRSIQTVASDSGMAVDAQLAVNATAGELRGSLPEVGRGVGGGSEIVSWGERGDDQFGLHGGDISVDDMEIYI